MTTADPMHRPDNTTSQFARRSLRATEWKVLAVAALVVLAACALVSQLPRWLGW